MALGPDHVPVVTDEVVAVAAPEIAVLSAMAHGSGPDREPVLRAFLAAVESTDRDHALLYSDVVLGALTEAARHTLEALMTTTGKIEYTSDFARRYYGQGWDAGEADGRVDSVLAVLDARGIDVPAGVEQRIRGSRDLDELTRWVRRAATVTDVAELFA